MITVIMWKLCLITLGMTMLLCTFVYRSRKRIFDLFDPYYWVTATCIMVMVFAPYTWVVQGKTHWHGIPVLENLPVASLFFGLSFISYTFCSIVKIKWKRRTRINMVVDETPVARAEGSDDRKAVMYGWVVWGIGLLLSVAYLRFRGRSLLTALTFGQYGEFTEESSGSFWFLNQGTRVLLTGSFIVLIYEKRHPKLARLAYLFMSIIVFSGGQRNQILVAVLAPVVFNYIRKGRRPKLRQVALFIFIAILALGWISYNRGTFRTGSGTIQNYSLEELWEAFMVNIEVFFPCYTMFGTVPSEVPHQFGISYLYTFIQFIPRFLWAGKPYPPVTKLMNAMFGEYAKWGPAYCIFAEMYLDFGLPGMIIGMGIFASVCQKMYKKGLGKTANTLDVMSFSLFLPYLFQCITRGYFSSIATEVFFMWGPLWGLRFLQRTVQWKR